MKKWWEMGLGVGKERWAEEKWSHSVLGLPVSCRKLLQICSYDTYLGEHRVGFCLQCLGALTIAGKLFLRPMVPCELDGSGVAQAVQTVLGTIAEQALCLVPAGHLCTLVTPERATPSWSGTSSFLLGLLWGVGPMYSPQGFLWDYLDLCFPL